MRERFLDKSKDHDYDEFDVIEPVYQRTISPGKVALTSHIARITPVHRRAISPGKVTLTSLIARAAPEVIQGGHQNTSTQHENSPESAQFTSKRQTRVAPRREYSDWMNIAFRPDLHPAPDVPVHTLTAPYSSPKAHILRQETADRLPENMSELLDQVANCADSQGIPLSMTLRVRMERILGANLDAVRIHTDKAAAQATLGVAARAFTLGDHIYFGAGEFAPDSREGFELLAHELTHVRQWQEGRVSAGSEDCRISEPSDPLEEEARAVAKHAADSGGPGSISKRDQNAHDAARRDRDMDEPGRASGARASGSVARGTVIQRSPISWLVKQVGKKAAVKAVKNYIKKNIKRKIKELTREKLKDHAKKFAQEADEIINILDDPWWMTAIEMIPFLGDAIGAGRFIKQLDKVWARIKSLEHKIDAIHDKLRRIKLVEADNLNKFRTAPANLHEQIAMKAARSGEGRVAMQKLGDPRLQGMDVIKMEYTHTAADGKKTVIHYFRDLELGRDFAHKFKD